MRSLTKGLIGEVDTIVRNYRTFVEGTQGSQVTDTSDVRKQPTGIRQFCFDRSAS